MVDKGTRQLLIIEENIDKDEIRKMALAQLDFKLTKKQKEAKVVSDYDFGNDIESVIVERCKNEGNCDFKDIEAEDLVKGTTGKDELDGKGIKESLAYEQAQSIKRYFKE